MSLIQKFSSWLLVGTVTTVGTVFMASSAIAQNTELDPLDGLVTDDDGSDLFGDTNSPYELIHRAILAPTMTPGEFRDYQNRAITGEAQNFRLLQQEALRQQELSPRETDEVSVDDEVL